MSLNDETKTKVRLNSEWLEKCEANIGMHRGSVLSPLLLAVVVDVVT